jgi:hypothetical protein
MQFWIIQGLNSLSLGALLFLLSSGFSLIFGLMRLANLTHGAFFMLGTYFAAIALRSFDWLNIWVAAFGAGVAVAVLGGTFERLVLTRLKANPLGQVLVTLGMSFIISDACLMLWGGDSIPVWIYLSNLPTRAGSSCDRRSHRAALPAGAHQARRDDPSWRRRPTDGPSDRNSRVKPVHDRLLPRRRYCRCSRRAWRPYSLCLPRT